MGHLGKPGRRGDNRRILGLERIDLISVGVRRLVRAASFLRRVPALDARKDQQDRIGYRGLFAFAGIL